jgi:hypothetical protein
VEAVKGFLQKWQKRRFHRLETCCTVDKSDALTSSCRSILQSSLDAKVVSKVSALPNSQNSWARRAGDLIRKYAIERRARHAKSVGNLSAG